MKFWAFIALIAAQAFPGPAAAQQTLEEIVVTAGFRDAALTEEAASVSVVDEDSIRDRAAVHLESILSLAPNVNYSSGASRARLLQIRGVGDMEQFVDPKHFPSVGLAIDGIDLSGTANAALLFDVEQVEILRGPQGTRFGTNALAGIVNVRANRPTDEYRAYVEAGISDYGGWNAGAVVNGAIGENAAARLTVQRNRGDGYIRNRFLGRGDTNRYDEGFARAAFEFSPSDRATIDLSLLHFESDNGYDAFSLDNTRETLSDQPGHDEQEADVLSLRGEWMFGEGLILEAGIDRLDSRFRYGFDEDWTYVGICDGTLCDPVWDFFSNTDDYTRVRDQLSIDVRLLGEAGAGGNGFRYVLGIHSQDRDEDLLRNYYGPFASFYRAERRAFYGQIEFEPADGFSFSVGLRQEAFGDDYSDSFGFASASDDDLSSGEMTAAYELGGDAKIYFTLSRGVKPGGVNTEASSAFPLMQARFQNFVAERLVFGQEALVNKEFGIKGRYLDDRLFLRAAIFNMDRDDAQLESWFWDDSNFLWVGFLDAADGSNAGFELELDYTLSDRLGVFGALGALDTDVDQITVFDLDVYDFVEHRGIDQAKASSWQYSVGVDLSSFRWNARVELEGRGSSRFGYYHEGEIDDYSLLNASLGYRFERGELRIWGRNLTDETYAVHGLYFGNDPRKGWINETYYQFGEPRLVGVSLRYDF